MALQNKQTYTPSERCSTHPNWKRKECERVRNVLLLSDPGSQNIEGTPGKSFPSCHLSNL